MDLLACNLLIPPAGLGHAPPCRRPQGVGGIHAAGVQTACPVVHSELRDVVTRNPVPKCCQQKSGGPVKSLSAQSPAIRTRSAYSLPRTRSALLQPAPRLSSVSAACSQSNLLHSGRANHVYMPSPLAPRLQRILEVRRLERGSPRSGHLFSAQNMGQAVDLICTHLADLPLASVNGTSPPQASNEGRRRLMPEDPAELRRIRPDRLYLGHPSVVVRALVIQARAGWEVACVPAANCHGHRIRLPVRGSGSPRFGPSVQMPCWVLPCCVPCGNAHL